MSKFIVLYTAPDDVAAQMAGASPADAKAGMEAWMTWAGACGEALADFGAPLGNGASVTAAGGGESASDVRGYSILEADSRDAAAEMLKGHPHLQMPGSCSIEVLEALPIPGM